MEQNITNKDEILHEIVSNLEYNFYSDENGFEILTNVRYKNMKSIPEAYFCSYDGKKIFKLTCEEVDISSLPESEMNVLKDHLEGLQEEI